MPSVGSVLWPWQHAASQLADIQVFQRITSLPAADSTSDTTLLRTQKETHLDHEAHVPHHGGQPVVVAPKRLACDERVVVHVKVDL